MICSRKILLFIILNTPLAIVAQVSELRDLRAALESGVNAPEKAKIYARLGMLYTERSVDSSLYFGTKALDLAREVQYDEVEARAKSVLAFCYMEQGKPFLAYKFAAEALATFEQLGLKEQTAEMHMNIGVLLMKEGNLRDAVPKFDLAYQESLKLDKDSIRSLIILNMISSKQDQLSLSQIENHYQDALTIARNYGDTRMEVLIRHSRASIMLRKGVPIQQVRGELKGVLEETKSLGYDYLQAISLMELAQVYLLDHLDTSLMHIQSALDLTENLGYDQMHFHMLNHAFQMLSTIEPVPPQLATIGERMKELAALRSKEFQNDGLGFLQLALREKELEVQQAKVAVRRQWAVFLSIAGTLAILIAAWATYQYSLKRRLTNKLRKALEELRVKNKQLEDNDLFNTRLIAVLSHDLRSPFASMVMMSSDILNELSPQEQKSIYEDMRRSSKVSLQVIDGLLHWMKLQTVGLAVTPSELNIKACIEQSLEFHEHDIERKNLSISIQVDNTITAFAQPEMLLFINRNLISNAIKYSPSSRQISIVSWLTEDDTVVVKVSDEGPGIPLKVYKNLFQKGRSTDNTDRNTVGAGLALIICYEMLEKLQGKIWAENNAESAGASFYYSLPTVPGKSIVSSQKVAEFQ